MMLHEADNPAHSESTWKRYPQKYLALIEMRGKEAASAPGSRKQKH